MGTYEIIKRLCDDRGIAITKLEKELGFGRGSIGKLKEGRQMNTDRIKKVAEYFDVPLELIMTGEVSDGYYVDPETAAIAQKIYQNKELYLLFYDAQDAKAEDLKLAHEVLLAMKRKELD